jgi:hypothetical protein
VVGGGKTARRQKACGALLEFNMSSKKVDGVRHLGFKCGMVARVFLCVIKMLISYNSSRRLAISSTSHCSVEGVDSAKDL